MKKLEVSLLAGVAGVMLSTGASAHHGGGNIDNSCAALPNWDILRSQLHSAVQAGGAGGFGFNMWATLVGNDGTVCAVAFSGNSLTDQWLTGRVMSAQSANAANGLSLAAVGGASSQGKQAFASANLYSPARDGGALFGVQFGNPDPTAAQRQHGSDKADKADLLGTPRDPMVGQRIGGVNVFGGGLALYDSTGQKVGGVGVSGDTSCTDHMVAWQLRHNLNLDFLRTGGVGGVAAASAGDTLHPDNIIFDITPNTATPLVAGNNGVSASGWGHPQCPNNPGFDPTTKTPLSLPPVQ